MMPINKNDIKKILVVNLGGIGDLLLSTPALRALKGNFPDARIYLLAVERVSGFMKRPQYIDRVISFRSGRSLAAAIADLFCLLSLRLRKIDLAVNMRTLVSDKSARKMKLLLDLVAPRIKAGRDTSGRGGFLDIKVPETDAGDKYEMEYDIDMVSALGARVEDKSIDIDIPEESSRKVRMLLSGRGIAPGDSIIAVHPGGRPSRRWPAGNYARVIGNLSKEFKAKFVITGGIDEKPLAEEIAAKSGAGAVDLCGKLDFYQLAALIKRCGLYITNDTGPMHIAAVLKTPTVAIFGPGHLERFDPRNIFPEAVVLYRKTDCAPCNKSECPDMKCLKAVSVDEVAQAAAVLLRNKGV